MSNNGRPNRLIVDAIERQSAEFLRSAMESNANLSVYAKLYAANRAMAAAMRTEQVGPALVEICSNLLGCEQVAIVEIESETERLQVLVQEGLSLEQRLALTENASNLQLWIEPGDPVMGTCDSDVSWALDQLGISAIVPLWSDSRSTVALVLFELLPQRDGFDEEDRTILQLLSIYAGPCLRSQRRD